MEEETQEIDVTNVYDINHLKSIIATLKSDLAVARVDLDNNKIIRQQRLDSHIQDIKLISDALMEQAEDRDWCDQYDNFIEELNTRLSIELEERTKEYEVEIEVTQTRTQRVTVTIKARDEDQARELIDDSPEDYYAEQITEYDWETDEEESNIIDVTKA
jgi:capsid protein